VALTGKVSTGAGIIAVATMTTYLVQNQSNREVGR
jgi:hypothetical protein